MPPRFGAILFFMYTSHSINGCEESKTYLFLRAERHIHYGVARVLISPENTRKIRVQHLTYPVFLFKRAGQLRLSAQLNRKGEEPHSLKTCLYNFLPQVQHTIDSPRTYIDLKPT
jgi:hypothetical protein